MLGPMVAQALAATPDAGQTLAASSTTNGADT